MVCRTDGSRVNILGQSHPPFVYLALGVTEKNPKENKKKTNNKYLKITTT
jgi:hypothetical protein